MGHNCNCEDCHEGCGVDCGDVQLLDGELTITLTDANNEDFDFIAIAIVDHNDEQYMLLMPTEEAVATGGLSEDEFFIFKLEDADEESQSLSPVEDDAILDAVAEKYFRAVADLNDEDEEGKDEDED